MAATGRIAAVPSPRPLLAALLATTALTGGAAAQDAPVTITVDRIGVGGVVRPGEVTALRCTLVSNLPGPEAIWVQWDIPNADGDVAEHGRRVTLAPGQPSLAWLYAPLLPTDDAQSVWTVRAYAMADGERGRELAAHRFSPSSTANPALVLENTTALIAVVGPGHLGLGGYASSAGLGRPPVSHEVTHVVAGIRVADLPDRWEGWKGFEAIAWGDEPPDLGAEKTQALRAYVRRGGHLAIVLPTVGNPWKLGAAIPGPFTGLLPGRPRRDEGVPLRDLERVLGHPGSSAQPTLMFSIRVFRDPTDGFDALGPDGAWIPAATLADGRVVAVQRAEGFGTISVLGIDLADRRLASVGLPSADVLWNRILGRRADAPSPSTLAAMEEAEVLSDQVITPHLVGGGGLVTQEIAMVRAAGTGLLLAFLLFLAYWVVAGPGGFYLLKHWKLQHLSWLGFAATGLAFTAIAWGLVGMLRERDVVVRHVTVLDHIYNGTAQRAVSWLSVHLPGYGPTPLRFDDDGTRRNLLHSWAPPGRPPQTFPNRDRYRVRVDESPSSFAITARATATELQAHWMGVVDEQRWGDLIRVENEAVHVVRDPSGRDDRLRGVLVNRLPGDLVDVSVIWVQGRRLPVPLQATLDGRRQPWIDADQSGRMTNAGHFWRVAAWPRGTPLDLSDPQLAPGPTTGLADAIDARYVDRRDPTLLTFLEPRMTPADRRRMLEALGLFRQLTPPSYHLTTTKEHPPNYVALRRLGRGIDLSGWFTRPCLIVTGFLKDSALPIPLLVDGAEPAESTGTTFVRWIHPLPDDGRLAFGGE